MNQIANARERRVLVLLSGGVDSSTCLAFYLGRGFSVQALFVDYGHPAAVMERAAARGMALHYAVTLQEATVQGVPPRESGYVPGRNALLVFTALATVAPPFGLVALGIHAGTLYPDCSPTFIEACQAVADVYANGALRVVAPFLDWSKGEVCEYARKVGVPLDQTYSCEAGHPEPCGRCLSCLDRARMR